LFSRAVREQITTLGATPSVDELTAVLGKIPACGILLEVITSSKASPHAKSAIQELAEFYLFGKFKLTENEVLILGKESLQSFVHELPAVQSKNAAKRRETRRIPGSASLRRREV
jgi:hypothetical protein